MTNQSRGELHPGGLALVIGSIHEDSCYIGTTVVLVKKTDSPFGEAWETESVSSGAFMALARNLVPINPEADHLDITEQMEQRV